MDGNQGHCGSNHPPGARAWTALWLTALMASCLLLLAACGGGGADSSPPAADSAGAALGSAGGNVSAADGALVVVPAGALSADTSVRIAKDSSGSPALPAHLRAVGNVYALTPHGTRFEQPVRVHIPVPATAPQPDQVIRLAKAELNGEWAVLWDSKVESSMLSAEIHDFSFVLPVAVTYPIPLATAAPLAVVAAVLDCGPQDCKAAVGPVDVTYRVTLNGGQLPSYCAPGSAEATMDSNTDWWQSPNQPVRVPLQGGTLQRRVTEGPSGVQVFWLTVTCTRPGESTRLGVADTPQATYVQWVPRPAYPDIRVLRAPATLELVAGAAARLDAMLSGGGAKPTGATPIAPTGADRAVVEWQRSDDDGRSWRIVALSYQDEADPLPFGGDKLWRYWSVRHGFTAQASDNGALLRVRACYTPPDRAAPACAVGPSTRLVVLQGAAAPVIDQAPRSMLVRAGQTASFNASAAGAPSPALQWQTREANAAGAWVDLGAGTGAAGGQYTTPVLTLADNGRQYRVVASNAVGSAESAPVTVSVSDLDVAPTFTSQPASLSVALGSDAALAVVARGTEALSYQWQFNGVNITGANAPLLRLAAVDGSKAGGYAVTVSNAAGTITSNVATLTVTPGAAAAVAPSIVTQPVSVLVNAGNTATFAVGVAGTAPFSYQWLKDGQAIAGATAAFYSLPAAAVGDAATYAVRVGNAVSAVTSFNVTLTVNASVQPTAVAITTQPAPQVQPAGGSATFAVAATGSGPLSYQWSKDGQPLAGQTAAVLTLASLTGGDAGSYSVAVGNALGTLNSNAAALTLLGMPAITAQPQAVTQTAGGTATFSVTASGQGLQYLWLRNGVPAAGGTAAQLLTPTLTQGDSGAVYSVIVFNAAGGVVSNTAVLTVNPVVAAASVLAGNIGSRGHVDGSGSTARLNSPVALALDTAGNAYVREPCLIRKVTPAGLVSTLAGVAGDCNIADGPPGTARVGGGTGIAVDASGNVYFSDGAGAIRKSTPAGVLSTLAGDALVAGYADGSGTSARFDGAHGLAIDAAGNLYVADTNNAAIRVVTPGGAVSTLARGRAGGGYSVVDGPVGVATFSTVVALTIDSAGAVYVADEGTNSIRKIAGGQVSTLAGSSDNNTGSAGSVDGLGAAARFNSPAQLAVDAAGNVYVADMLNATVRKITPGGLVSTVLGVVNDQRTLPAATPPRISYPAGLALAATGPLWLTSLDTHVVLRATVP